MNNILRLTLTRNWFDLIASGEKVFEYREYKKHWIRRLLGKSGTRVFDEVYFTNGYGSDRPFMRVEFVGMAVIEGVCCLPNNGEQLDNDKKYFVIALGDILEVRNT